VRPQEVARLILHDRNGTADATVPFAWGAALHHAIPRSEFHAIDGAGHGVLQWPAAAAALREWVLRLTD